MKLSIALQLGLLAVVVNNSAISGCSDPDTSPTPSTSTDCTGNFLVDEVNAYEQSGSYEDPSLSVTCTTDTVEVKSNGIPNFEFVQITPNALKTQNYTWHLTRNPKVASAPTAIWMTGPVGIAVNGLPIYAPNEAPNDGYKDPVLDGILDYCNGHTGPAGEYHFHARPECLFESIDGQVNLVLGYAFDGFPIVAPFECTDSGCSSVKSMKSSYVYVGGSTNAYTANQYQAGKGDLDKCNGAYAPDGSYRYYASDTFPYVIGCFSGTPDTSNAAGGGGQPPPPQP